MRFGNNSETLAQRRILQEGSVEISERAFNAIFGGVLLWGLLLNYAIVALFGNRFIYVAANGNPAFYLIIYLISAIAGSALIATPKPSLSFLGYNMIVLPIGFELCIALGGYANDTIRTAVLLTIIYSLAFMILANIWPGFFKRMGPVLFCALLVGVIGGLICAIAFGRSYRSEWIGAGLFALYIGYDWHLANTCARTVDNAIDLAASMYLDIINLFLRILSILARNKRRHD